MPRPPSPHDAERRRRPDVSPPDYMDEFGGHHHQPAQDRPRRPRFAEDDRDRREERPRRAKSYRDPRPRPSPSESPPPPRRRRDSPPPRRAPPPGDDYDDPNRTPRRRRPRDDDYYSDSRHDRPRREVPEERPRRREAEERPRRYDDRYDDRPRRRDDERYDDRPRSDRRDRDRYDDRLLRDSRDDRVRPRSSAKNEPQWQRQAKEMFFTHALPVIKKEGPRLIAKHLGTILGKQGGGGR